MGGGILPTERQVQRAILQMAGLCFPRVLIHHSPNGAQLAGNAAARFKQIGALKGDGFKNGFPDLLCLWAGGRGAFLEVKRPKGSATSDAQKEMHDRLNAMGWPCRVVKSVEEAYEFLKECGAPWSGATI
jgi:hypothetical protein